MKARQRDAAFAGFVLMLGVLLAGSLGARAQPAEPQGYRMDDYRAPTPAAVAGGAALDTAAAQQLWKTGGAAWIDVLAAPHRPANLPAAAVWLPVPRRDIPGSLWLPDVGHGRAQPRARGLFPHQPRSGHQHRRDTPVVFYCLANCWMSWNAAKRAASWGYTQIYWYRDGTDGWEAAKLPLAVAEPVPGYR